jgi:hypothetical protein
LLSPRFGFNAGSLAAFAAMVLALLLGTAVPTAVSAAYRQVKRQDLTVRLHTLPAGLAIAALCVFISRISDFRPGYLYGVVCGLVFGTKLAKHQQGHVVALSAIATLAVSVGAWFAWVPVYAAASRPGANLGIVLAEDFLAAAFVSGLVGTVIGLLPFRFLPGGDLFNWHRGAWLAAFAVALFGTVQVMLRPVTGPTHPGHAPIVTAIILFVAFGALSITFRNYAVKRQRERDHADDAPEHAPETNAPEPPTAESPIATPHTPIQGLSAGEETSVTADPGEETNFTADPGEGTTVKADPSEGTAVTAPPDEAPIASPDTTLGETPKKDEKPS